MKGTEGVNRPVRTKRSRREMQTVTFPRRLRLGRPNQTAVKQCLTSACSTRPVDWPQVSPTTKTTASMTSHFSLTDLLPASTKMWTARLERDSLISCLIMTLATMMWVKSSVSSPTVALTVPKMKKKRGVLPAASQSSSREKRWLRTVLSGNCNQRWRVKRSGQNTAECPCIN